MLLQILHLLHSNQKVSHYLRSGPSRYTPAQSTIAVVSSMYNHSSQSSPEDAYTLIFTFLQTQLHTSIYSYASSLSTYLYHKSYYKTSYFKSRHTQFIASLNAVQNKIVYSKCIALPLYLIKCVRHDALLLCPKNTVLGYFL